MTENRIGELKRTLDRLQKLNSGEIDRLLNDFTVRHTYNSNAIEGNSLTLEETGFVLMGVAIGEKPLRDQLDIVGYRDAFYYVRELAEERAPLSEKVIKELHSLTMLSDRKSRGHYRSVPVFIRGAEYTPVPPEQIKPLMEKLISDYRNSRDGIAERIAKLHFGFEKIHPFSDGNGRTGRLIVNPELMKEGYPPIDIPVSDRERYFQAFRSEEEMICLFKEYIENALINYIDIVENAQR